MKAQWIRDKSNFYYNNPISQAYEYVNVFVSQGKFDHKSSIENQEFLTFEVFCEMSDSFLQNGFVEWFVFGNASLE